MRKRKGSDVALPPIVGVSRDDLAAAWAAAKDGPHPFDPCLIRDAHDVRAVLAGCWFDPAAGQHIIDFFASYLRHSKGQWAGQPFVLQPWQEEITRRLFGWKRADGTRRYRKAYIEIPKKNGKSTWLAGIELYLFVGDGEPGAEVYCCAVDKDQAGIVFSECATMVRQSPELSKVLGRQIADSRKTITDIDNAGKLAALSADAPKQEGLNIHGACVDELHAHKNRVMWDTIVYGGAARRQPLLVMITTAGIYDPASIGWIQHEYARKVIDNQIDDWSFLAVIYGAGEKDDWTDPAVWEKANPSFGVTINRDTFAEECRAAQQDPGAQNSFRRYRLNQWVRQVTRAIDLTAWDAGAGHAKPMTVARRSEWRGRTCDIGLDLSSVNDITAAAYAFPGCEDDAEAIDVFVRMWVPRAQLDNPKNPNRDLYAQWEKDGFLEVVPGRTIRYDAIKDAILSDAAIFEVRDVCIDHLFQGQHLATELEEEGFSVFAMRQGFISFGPAWKEFKRLYLEGKLHHGNHPGMRWAADNTETVSDPAGNEKVVKPMNSHSPKKVDPIIAGVMAVDRTRRHGIDDTGGSDYEHGEGAFIVG